MFYKGLKMLCTIGAFTLACQNGTNRDDITRTSGIIGDSANFQFVEDPTIKAKHGLINTGERVCNSFLVAEDQVGTALHCIGEDPLAFIGFRFENFQGFQTDIVDIAFLDDRKDYVVYQLSEPVAQGYTYGKATQGDALTLIAFDLDSETLVAANCQVVSLLPDQSAFAHSCDTKKGYSGSAVISSFGDVVGMHYGFNPKKGVNYASDFGLRFDDSSDIASLPIDVELEWPHVRSPHVRSPHIRSPLPDVTRIIREPLKSLGDGLVSIGGQVRKVNAKSVSKGLTQAMQGLTKADSNLISAVLSTAFATFELAVCLESGGTAPSATQPGIPACAAAFIYAGAALTSQQSHGSQQQSKQQTLSLVNGDSFNTASQRIQTIAGIGSQLKRDLLTATSASGFTGRVVNRSQNQCLYISDGATSNGSKVHLTPECDRDATKWRFERIGNDIRIRNLRYNKCLNLSSDQNRDNGYATIWDCVAHPDQAWLALPYDDGSLSLRNPHYGRCLNQQPDQHSARVWNCNKHTDQSWSIRR